MISMSTGQLTEIINGQLLSLQAAAVTFDGVGIDSRTIQPGQVFFAIKGANFDGHKFAQAAIDKGASCVVLERRIEDLLPNDSSVIMVDNTITALGKLAAWYRHQLSAKVVAITGSVGKTTTRDILYQILSRHYKCRQAQKSFNNHIGVPLTILSAERDDEFLLVELGSNAPGEIEKLSKIAGPDIAIISRVAPAHLEGFGSIENIIREKSAIAEGLSPDGTLFVNGDQPELVDYVGAAYDVDIVTVGTGRDCDVTATDLRPGVPNGSFVIEGQVVNVPLPAKANLLNVLSAWAVCRQFISLSDFMKAVGCLLPCEMRLEVVTIGSLMVLDDCYNASPASMANALHCLGTIAEQTRRRSVFVAGCMAELGKQANLLHEKLGEQSARCSVEVLLAAGPYAEQIVQGAQNAAKLPLECQAFENTDQLCDNLHKWVKPDDIILVKGSRSAHMEKAIGQLQKLFENK